ncbi:uncharacterized protein LOC122241090 isoform X1 [Panthera tigris]|uniref:uncharacterized protein LOC122241090 isoform X1 n=1 Tax=Panthera tigris TaxID=9694 RepID=UPI001C6FAE4A|nr:uncharacterized protein LOC122241090 isoform X1 [Panthera tigris]
MRKRTTEMVSATGGTKAEAAARLFPPGPRAPSVTRSLHLRTQSPRQSPARHRLRPQLHAERTGARAPPQAPGVWPTQAGPAPRFSQHLHTQLQRCRTDQHSGPPTDIWSHNREQQRKRSEAKDKILKKPREQPKVQREGGRAHPGCWVTGRGRPGDREDLVCLGPHAEGTGQPHRAAPDGRPEWRPGGGACNTPLAASLSRLPRARCGPETHGRTRHRAAPREADVPKKRVGSRRRGEARSSSGGASRAETRG